MSDIPENPFDSFNAQYVSQLADSEADRIKRREGITATGLVGELANFMCNNIPTNPDWCENLAACLVGTIAGATEDGKIREIRNSFGPLRPNIFTIYIGASRLGFKTVPLKTVVRPALIRVTEMYNSKVCLESGITIDEFYTRKNGLAKADAKEKKTPEWKKEKSFIDKIGTQLVNFEMPENFTSEALVSWLTTHPIGMIASDEFTNMFKGVSTKDYMSNVMEVLSRLYDSEVEKKATIARGVENAKNIHVCFASATTPYLMTLMDDSFFWQGTGNRILWIVDDVLDKIDQKEEENFAEFFWNPDKSREFDAEFERILTLLAGIRNLPEGQVLLSFGASAELNKYRINMYNKAVGLFMADMMDRDSSFVAGLAQNAMKLALIHCIGRYAMDSSSGNYTGYMEINEEDSGWAIKKMDRHLKFYHKLWELSSRVRSGSTKSYKVDEERILSIIEKVEITGKKLSVNKLRNQTGWLKDDCQKVLETMALNGTIRVVNEVINGKVYTFYTKANDDT